MHRGSFWMSARVLHSIINPIGPNAGAIASLWWVMLWTTSIAFILTLVFFALAIARGRRRTAPIDGEPTNQTRLVSSAVALTVAILFGLLVVSIRTGHAVASDQTGAAVTVEVIGHQWWWEIEYEDQDASRRVVVANEMHIPIGRPVVLKVTSRDVIHSFWVPNIQGKRDLIPGYTTAIWMQADRPGVFRGQCAEFCGRQHAHMAFALVAEPQEAFDRWREGQRQNAHEPQDAAAKRGREIFMTTRCAGCHAIRGTEAAGQVAPDLTHVAGRGAIGAGILPNTPDHLAEWIENPQTFKPGNQMPPNPLPAEDLGALVAYLKGLQ
jgi:cytochrome c oxidase subunit II